MRLPGSEKLEIIRLVAQSHLPARRTSSFLEGYDDPEILPSSSRNICLTGADVGHFGGRTDYLP